MDLPFFDGKASSGELVLRTTRIGFACLLPAACSPQPPLRLRRAGLEKEGHKKGGPRSIPRAHTGAARVPPDESR